MIRQRNLFEWLKPHFVKFEGLEPNLSQISGTKNIFKPKINYKDNHQMNEEFNK